MSYCQPKMLVEGTYFNIAQCSCCKRIGLYYKNLLVAFNQRDFIAFATVFCTIDFNKRAMLFPDGKRHMVIDTCHQDIQFTFIKDEFDELKNMFREASILLEAQNIIEQSN